MTSVRFVGALAGAILGVCAMFLPIGLESWYPGIPGYPAPPAIGAVVGSAAAGFLLAKRVVVAPPSKLGLLAALFAVVAAMCAAPVFAGGGAVWSIVVPPDAGDELFHPGPVMSAAIDVVVFGAVALVLAIPQGLVWIGLMRRVSFGDTVAHVTFSDAD